MEEAVTFEETLHKHLRAIHQRDLEALVETLAPVELVLVAATGEVSSETSRFIELHREWFGSPTWSLGTEVVHVREGADLATCLIKLDYRDEAEGGAAIEEHSVLSLVFQRVEGRWLLVQDQNTPITTEAL